MQNKPNYYSIITFDVLYNENINSSEKLLYATITSLSQKDGYCYANNDYLAELYKTTNVTISRQLNNLKKWGFIEIEYEKKGAMVINRKILPLTKMLIAVNKNVNRTVNKNVKDNNIILPNNINNIIKDIVEYLNLKAYKNYKHTTSKTKTLINARFNEGFTKEDFIRVIDKKVAEWLNDKKMNQYLRPETLFGTKFEGYLNQKDKELTTKDIEDKIDWSDF